jgi:hypothetical protein
MFLNSKYSERIYPEEATTNPCKIIAFKEKIIPELDSYVNNTYIQNEQ